MRIKISTVAALIACAFFFTACGGGEKSDKNETKKEKKDESEDEEMEDDEDMEEDYEDEEEMEDVEEDMDDESSDDSSADWDQTLDDYEEYVDEYIVVYKKAMKGDATAAADYPSLLEKAQDLQSDLEDAKDNLTTEQASRLLKIQNKLVNAASGK